MNRLETVWRRATNRSETSQSRVIKSLRTNTERVQHIVSCFSVIHRALKSNRLTRCERGPFNEVHSTESISFCVNADRIVRKTDSKTVQ